MKRLLPLRLPLVHIHLDAVGGVAGDMFVAAMIDAWPEHDRYLIELLRCVDLPGVSAEVINHDDGTLVGRRFTVDRCEPDAAASPGVGAHGHESFREIRAMLLASSLPSTISERAVHIFTLLAEAEGRVHGCEPDDIVFHEVGAWDSIIDIVAAAAMIDKVGSATWSVGPLPLGSGVVDTAHGILPVPAPATVILLEGLPVVHDAVPGERVTPTGAAIVRHLCPAANPPSTPMMIDRCGHGFGTKLLPGMSNMLRVVSYEPIDLPLRDRVGVVQFEVDDQTPEDLAVGLDRLRERPDVLDVTQASVMGKKGRLASHIRVLARPEAVEAVIDACFRETATIGVRFGVESRVVLERSQEVVSVGEEDTRVKTSQRPGGATSKAEMDDLAAAGDRDARASRRSAVEAAAGEVRHDG